VARADVEATAAASNARPRTVLTALSVFSVASRDTPSSESSQGSFRNTRPAERRLPGAVAHLRFER
jgi:hypothetical protein